MPVKCYAVVGRFYPLISFKCTSVFRLSEETIQYEGPGVELPFPPLDDVDPLLVLQLRHRYKAVCLALKHTLRLCVCVYKINTFTMN